MNRADRFAWARKAALALYPAACLAAYLAAVFLVERMHK